MSLSIEEIIKTNQTALSLITNQKFSEAEKLLSKLFELMNSNQEPSIAELITLNNLSMIYSKTGQIHLSVKCLTRASQFKTENKAEFVYLIGTHLNFCVINGILGHYASGIQEGYKALYLLAKINMPETSVLTFYNMAIQFASMKKHGKAAEFLKNSVVIAENKLGKTHKLVKFTTKACSNYFYKSPLTRNIKSSSFSSKSISYMKNPSKFEKNLHLNISTDKNLEDGYHHTTNILEMQSIPKLSIKTEHNGNYFTRKVIKKTINIGQKFSNTPKTIRKIFLNNYTSNRSTAVTSVTTSFHKNEERLEGRVKNITNYLSTLQSELDEFTVNSKFVKTSADLENFNDKNEHR